MRTRWGTLVQGDTSEGIVQLSIEHGATERSEWMHDAGYWMVDRECWNHEMMEVRVVMQSP